MQMYRSSKDGSNVANAVLWPWEGSHVHRADHKETDEPQIICTNRSAFSFLFGLALSFPLSSPIMSALFQNQMLSACMCPLSGTSSLCLLVCMDYKESLVFSRDGSSLLKSDACHFMRGRTLLFFCKMISIPYIYIQ